MLDARLIRDILLGALATPTVAPAATPILSQVSADRCLDAAARILRLAHLRNPRFSVQREIVADNQLTLTLSQPQGASVTFRVLRLDDIEGGDIPADAQVLLLAVDTSDDTTREVVS